MCGDGFVFTVTQMTKRTGQIAELHREEFSKTPGLGAALKEGVELYLDLFPGDKIDFMVDARSNHDCDGIYIVEISFWPALS